MARGRIHSRFPAAVAMKRRDPKSTVAPGTHEAFALAICSVKMKSIVDALFPFLARQLSVFRIPTSIVRASKLQMVHSKNTRTYTGSGLPKDNNLTSSLELLVLMLSTVTGGLQ